MSQDHVYQIFIHFWFHIASVERKNQHPTNSAKISGSNSAGVVLVNSADAALVTCTNTATFPAMIIGSNSASGFFVLLVNSADTALVT